MTLLVFIISCIIPNQLGADSTSCFDEIKRQFAGVKGQYVGKGLASTYRPWIKSSTVPNARYPGNWHELPRPTDLVCAHRTIPFWTVLRLRLRSRVAYCTVLDRGTYGFCEKVAANVKHDRQCPIGHRYRVIVKRWKRMRTLGWYRGLIDATPAVHRMMGSDGWQVVHVEKLRLGRRRRRVLRLKRLSAKPNPSPVYVQTRSK